EVRSLLKEAISLVVESRRCLCEARRDRVALLLRLHLPVDAKPLALGLRVRMKSEGRAEQDGDGRQSCACSHDVLPVEMCSSSSFRSAAATVASPRRAKFSKLRTSAPRNEETVGYARRERLGRTRVSP